MTTDKMEATESVSNGAAYEEKEETLKLVSQLYSDCYPSKKCTVKQEDLEKS